jgi:hypothetical protein
MNRKAMKVGRTVQVINDRWDSSPGMFAIVERVGYVGSPKVWSFRVRWLNQETATKWGKLSTNLFEEDLADFEVYRLPKQ